MVETLDKYMYFPICDGYEVINVVAISTDYSHKFVVDYITDIIDLWDACSDFLLDKFSYDSNLNWIECKYDFVLYKLRTRFNAIALGSENQIEV